jgi:carbon monoxide dehydrogenase subunit G
MHLEGEYSIKCPQAAAWKFISDPRELAQCLPDLQRLDVKDSTHFSVAVKVGMAFVRGTFRFDFTLLDQEPPSHSRFEAVGKGAGVSVRLQAALELKETETATTQLSWKCDLELGGLLGEISPSLIQGSADKFTRDFFSCIKSKLESSPGRT